MDDAAATDLLTRAVATPSVSGDEREVAELFAAAMAGFADRAWVDEAGNAMATLGTGPLRVAFLGHIDTVPGEIPVRRVDDVLYGRGSVDAKGPFSAAVAAASRLTAGARDALTLHLIGAVEEEAPSSKGARHAVATVPVPDLVVIGEPSGWDSVTLGYKGRLVVAVEAEVPNAHSAGADPTAPEVVVDAWLAVRSWAQEASPEDAGIFDAVQCTLQEIDSRSDGLAQTARATIGLRLPPACPPERARAELEALELGPAVRLSFLGAETPYRGPRDTALTRAFRVAIRAEGGRPRTNIKTGTSDMNVVAPAWDVPMVAYGPGDASLDHTPREHVALSEYLRAVRVLTRAFEGLAASAQSPDSS